MTHHPIHQTSCQTRRGFTLTELMVVVVIIIIVVALSLTGMNRMRAYADKAGSTRNLSQLQIANTSYAADNSGRYVSLYATDDDGARTGFWYQDAEFLSYLIGDVTNASGQPTRAAPPSHLDPKVYRARKSMYYSMAASYGMCDSGLMGQTGPNVKASNHVSRISNPASSMAFATSTDYRITYNSRFNWKEADSKSSDGAIAYRYGDKAIVVYFDGHIGEMGKSDIKEIDSSRGGKNSPFWKPTAQ